MKPLFLFSLSIARVSAVFTAISDSGADYIDLGGDSWRVINANGSVAVNATVPGLIQTDLFAAGVIPDPIYGGNCKCHNFY